MKKEPPKIICHNCRTGILIPSRPPSKTSYGTEIVRCSNCKIKHHVMVEGKFYALIHALEEHKRHRYRAEDEIEDATGHEPELEIRVIPKFKDLWERDEDMAAKLLSYLMDSLSEPHKDETRRYKDWTWAKEIAVKYGYAPATVDIAGWNLDDALLMIKRLRNFSHETLYAREGGDNDYLVKLNAPWDDSEYYPKSIFYIVVPDPKLDASMPYPLLNWLKMQSDVSGAEEEVPLGTRVMNKVVDSARFQRYITQQMKLEELQRKMEEIKILQKELLLSTLDYPNVLIL